MDAPVFVDTNVLLYAVDKGDPAKQRAARAWREALWRSRRGRLSFQVLQEFYVQASRINPRARKSIREEIDNLLHWAPVVCDESVLRGAFAAQDNLGFSFWDCLIVSAARASGCRHLLTEDLQHGQDVVGIQVISPFRTTPADLGLQ